MTFDAASYISRSGSVTGHLGVLLIAVGSPAEPTVKEIRKFLKRVLSDERHVDMPAWQWQPVLNTRILPTRPATLVSHYQNIWGEDGSPYTLTTRAQASFLASELWGRGYDVPVELCYKYSDPDIGEGMARLMRRNVDHIIVLPLIPQYASATTGSILAEVCRRAADFKRVPQLSLISDFCGNEAYLNAVAKTIVNSGYRYIADGKHKLIFSFHSVPMEDIEAGDPYYDQCHFTARQIAARLRLSHDAWKVAFQNDFDKRQWLAPSLDSLLGALSHEGVSDVTVVSPGFVADNLETLYECAKLESYRFEQRATANQFTYIPCVNTDDDFISALADIVIDRFGGMYH